MIDAAKILGNSGNSTKGTVIVEQIIVIKLNVQWYGYVDPNR